jgi:MFS family permease
MGIPAAVYFPIAGAIIGQIFVGLICDRIGRKVALVSTTLLIVLGCVNSWLWLRFMQLSFCYSATLGTAAHGAHGSVQGLFWFLTVARGITGVVSGQRGRTVHIENGPLLGRGRRISRIIDKR